MSKSVAVLGVCLGGAYSYHVFQNRTPPEYNTFAAGSAEERLMNKLQTGDVAMFRRKWHNYHIPGAVLISAYQSICKSRFDHCGIVIEDNHGNYYLYENTLFGGYKLRPFDARILHSLSSPIEVVPMRPCLQLTNVQKREIFESVKKNVTNQQNECTSLFVSLIVYTIKQIFPDLMMDSYNCPNIHFLVESLSIIHCAIDGNRTEVESNQLKLKMLEGPFRNMNCIDVHNGNFFDQLHRFMKFPKQSTSTFRAGMPVKHISFK